MERETPQLGPPKVPKVETLQPPSSTERTGLFERWVKKDKKAPVAETAQSKPEANAETAEASKPARKKIGEFIFGLFGEKPAAVETPEVQSQATTEQTAETVEQPEVVQRATRARRFARLVINRVMSTASAESVQLKPVSTETLQDAAEDLQEADEELGETLSAAHGTSAEFSAAAMAGFETAAELVTGSVTAARIVERVGRLEKSAERSRATAIAAVGLGVIAVLVAGHEYFGKKRAEKKVKEVERVVGDQRDQLAHQEVQFAKMQQTQERVDAMNRTRRQEYYDRLSQFTHAQAEVTRGITREVQEAELRVPRGQETEAKQGVEWQPVRTAEVLPRPEPLARVETADRVEFGPSKSNRPAGDYIGGSAAGGIPGAPVQGEYDDRAPLSPAALREKALLEARMARLRSNAWLYGLALAGAGIIIAALLIFS